MAILSPPSTTASDDQAVQIFSFAQDRLLFSGGPDVFGYTFKDFNEVGIPASASPEDSDTVTATNGELAYVNLYNNNLVALVDTATHSVVGTVYVGASGCWGPSRAKMTPDGAYVYVTCESSGSVVVIETAGNTVVANVTGILYATDVAFTRDGAYALVGSTMYTQIAVIDTATYNIVNTIPTSSNVNSLAAHPYLDIVYATSYDGHVLVIDTTTFTTIDSIPFGWYVWDVVVSPDGQWVFASDRYGGGVAVINAETNTLYTTITGLGELTGLEISPDGSLVFAAGLWNGIHVINGTSFSLITTLRDIGFAWEAAVTCDGSQLFVGNQSDRVVVIDTQTFTVIAQIPVPGSTYGIAICPQYGAPGVFLSPPAQTNQGGRGQVVAHEERLVNVTGATDSFTLTLGSHIWDTALSTSNLGPIAHGDSLTFTVYVTVPVGVDWYSTDTVIVTVTSVTSPTVYSGMATLTTQAYAPPSISVSPDVLTSTQDMNQIVTKPLTISNGNGVTLTFNIMSADLARLVLWNKLGSDDEVLHSEVGENGTIVGTSYAYEPAMFGNGYVKKEYWQNYLRFPASILDRLTQRGAVELWVNPKVPQPVPYQYGVFGLLGAYYGHGGEPTDWNIGLFWGDTVTFRGLVGGIRFDGSLARTPDEPSQFVATPLVPFHAAISWDIAGIDGTADKVRVYRNGAVVGSTTDSWNPDGTQRGDIILETTADSGGADKFIVDNIKIWNYAKTDFSDRFVESPVYAPWLSTEPVSGTVTSNSSTPVQVTFDATGLQPRDYTTTISILSNDPIKPLTSVPVTMTVNPTANMGWVEGTVTDVATGAPLTATIVALGQPYTVTTKPDGTYKLWLDANSYTIQATAEGYVTGTAVVNIVAQQGVTQNFALELNVPRLEVSPESLQVTHQVGEVTTRVLTITNAGPAPLDFEISSGGGVSFFAVSTELYGYDVPAAWLRVVGTEDNTRVRVINLIDGTIIAENTDLDRYAIWDVYPNDGTPYKVKADKPVVGYERYLYADGYTAFVPSLDSGPVGREFIFYYDPPHYFYVFAIQDAQVKVYDTFGSLVASRTMLAGQYWDLSLSGAVYHVISTGRIAIETVGTDGYSTVPAADGKGIGKRFYFATDGYWTGAFAVFAYQSGDVNVYDLDSGSLLYSQHINQGDYWWQRGVGTRRLRLESTGSVEVWAGDAEGCCGIEGLGDDISFAGGDRGREYYLHSLIDGSVIFAPFDNTQVNVDGTLYHLDKDEYLYLSGCCYFRHIQSNQPILIQTLGRDNEWNNVGTYLGGVLAGRGNLPSWLMADPLTGTVSAHSSVPVQVTFNATGVQPGTYTAPIVVRSNDPITPLVSIPVTMTVLPTADMGRVTGAVSDAWTGQPLTATVELVGVYLMTASPDYTIWATAGPYSLTAYTTDYYTTTRSVTITASSVVTENLALEPAQPRLEWAPAAVTARAVEGSKVTQTLTILNTGPVPLNVALHEINPAVAMQALSSTDLAGRRILYDLAHGEPRSSEYSSLVSDLTNAGAVVTENWYFPIDAAVLEGYDVLWVNCCGSITWGFHELQAVNDWLNKGGAVLVQGESSAATNGPASIFDINYFSASCTSGTTKNIVEHPISEGVSAVNVEWTCWRLAPGSGAEIVVFDPQGQPHVVAQERNGGKMVVVASEDFLNSYIDYDDNRLLANNILAWLARPAYSDVPWLSETPVGGTIPGHSSLPVALKFDATTLSPGDYQATLAIEHNDPAQSSPVELPVTLTVVKRQWFLPLILKNGG
jgi:YVTN family beta-propeller protein